MKTLTIQRCFTSDPFDDGNVVVTLKTAEGQDVKYTVYPGKENPFENYQEVNGRSIRCDLTAKGYIAGGKFEWAEMAASTAGPPPTANGAPQQSASPQATALQRKPNTSDPRQESIERQACMKTAAELFDSCVSNGVVHAQNWDDSQISDWVASVASQLKQKCLG